MAVLSLSRMAMGVPLGAKTPHQVDKSKSLMPAYKLVGVLGNSAKRLAPVTAMSSTLFCRM